jgi:RNA polymerase sigma-70 factor (ECF subfamily)
MKNKFALKNDYELIQIVRDKTNDSTLAFEEIYNRYSKRIYTYCLRYLSNNKELANDIFQDVFERFYETIIKNKINIDNISAFLLRIAKNLSINEKNKRSYKNISIEGMDFPYKEENSIENNEINQLLKLAIDSLPKDYKESIVMKEFMDMSYNEIAEALEIDISIVRIRIYRAKQKIKELLKPYLNELEYNKN